MSYKIAFDKNLGLEFLVFPTMYQDKKTKLFFSPFQNANIISPIGTFLLIFLNTDFKNIDNCISFIYKFCFEDLYYSKYPEIKQLNKASITNLKVSSYEFLEEINELAQETQRDFLYLKYTLLKMLRLPYDTNFFRECDHEAEFSQEEINDEIQKEKNYYENKSIKYDEIEINGFIEDLNINFETVILAIDGINIVKYNIPYFFESEDIFGIIALIFKEFMSNANNTIRQCQNCGKYFIPSSLKETKYCNQKFENTGKTCRQIGKELAYKKSLQNDKLLDKYRKRYMSLASSVSHYGTDKAIERFERYKKDGAIMKSKYLNQEISAKEFENWILDSKNK